MIILAIMPLLIGLALSIEEQPRHEAVKVVLCDMKNAHGKIYYDSDLNRCYVRDYK